MYNRKDNYFSFSLSSIQLFRIVIFCVKVEVFPPRQEYINRKQRPELWAFLMFWIFRFHFDKLNMSYFSNNLSEMLCAIALILGDKKLCLPIHNMCTHCFLFVHAQGRQNFPGQGSNPWHSSDLNHNSDRTGSFN